MPERTIKERLARLIALERLAAELNAARREIEPLIESTKPSGERAGDGGPA